MPLLLPNLDDRRWADLIDEGRALIPVYGPEWTDHNVHDPGITLMELLAWIAEMDIYELNQIPELEKRKFLALVGIFPQPPLTAHGVLTVGLADRIATVELPAGLEFLGEDSSLEPTRYRTLHAFTAVHGSIDALLLQDAHGFHNLTPAWRRREILSPFGRAPLPGVEFYLGLTSALPIDVPVHFFFTVGGGRSGPDELHHLLQEIHEEEEQCHPPKNPCQESGPAAPPEDDKPEVPLRHHGVRTVWEFQAVVAGKIQWVPLKPEKDEIKDYTRAFTLDGFVIVRVPTTMAPNNLGAVSHPYFYLRCRFEAGAYDAAPMLQDVAFNGIRVEQAVPTGMSFVIDPKAKISYSAAGPPKPNDLTTLRLELDSRKNITQLTFGGGNSTDPKFLILDFRAPSAGAPGKLTLEGVFVGFGNGLPGQQVTLPDAPVQQSSFQLFTLESNTWYPWEIRPDFDPSTRRDFHFLLVPTLGVVTFGNGEKGRVPPEIRGNGGAPREKCLIFAIYRATRAEAGNLAAGTITKLADSAHNRAILYDPRAVPPDGWSKLKSQLASVTNPLPSSGGAAAETIAHASGRAVQVVETSGRAVTLADYERLAATTPGTRIARVTARANLHPSFPCFDAQGMITVIVLPYLPQGRPVPSPGLRRAVTAYLRRRRVIGTRVEVVSPKYLDVAVRAQVQASAGINKTNLQKAIVKALNDFLDPLKGGPDGTGWPFGRDVYRSEIMRVIDGVAGVDHILSLDLIAQGCEPQCGNVCLGPTWLAAAGAHEIEVV